VTMAGALGASRFVPPDALGIDLLLSPEFLAPSPSLVLTPAPPSLGPPPHLTATLRLILSQDHSPPEESKVERVLQSAWARSVHPAWTRDDVLRLTKQQLARALDSVRKYKPSPCQPWPSSSPHPAALPQFAAGPAMSARGRGAAVPGEAWMLGLYDHMLLPAAATSAPALLQRRCARSKSAANGPAAGGRGGRSGGGDGGGLEERSGLPTIGEP
jgi:hypothetical protein